MSKTVLIIGAFDTKGEEYAFVKRLIEARGHQTLTVHSGVFPSGEWLQPDVSNAEVARAAGAEITELQEQGDRGRAMQIMSEGLPIVVRRLFDEGRFDGVIGMGGTGGTSVITAGMRALPLGAPKVMVSTAAGGDTAPYVGTRDIAMFPSVADVSGVNRITRPIYTRAAGAICGMVDMDVEEPRDDRPVIVASMFGNTTECVDMCRESLTAEGYEVLVFHATGVGGRTMEGLVDDGLVEGVLDITTTEWADELAGGIFSAGSDRLSAPGRVGVPHLIVPGCVDMVNFGPRETVPERHAGRLLYAWNPSVTLMRTTPEENAQMGAIFAEKANRAAGPVAFLLPLRGVSILDSEGELFWAPDADRAMFDAIKANVRRDIAVIELDANINDRAFADIAVKTLLSLMAAGQAA